MAYNPVPLVAQGGTGLTSGTSGGILAFTASGVLASSAALTANAIVLGGGAGAVPTVLGSLGTNITVLHGNASGAPTFGAVNLATDVTGNLSTSNLNGGSGASSSTFWCGNGTWASPGGGVSSVTGDGTVINNSGSTGAVTLTLAQASAGTVLGNPSNASAVPSYTSAPVLGKNATTAGTLGLANGGTSGTTVTIQNLGATTAYNFNLPATAGSSGNILTSGGGASTSNTWTATTGTGNVVLSANQTLTGLLTAAAANLTGTVNISGLTASQAVFTDSLKNLVSNAITGTGSVAMSNNATLITPILGTPQSGTLTNCTGLPLGGIVNISNATILSNVSGGAAAPAANTMTSLLDIIGATQGDILYRGASVWTALAPGSNGTVLTSGGAAANPSWTSVGGTGTVTSVTFTGDGTVLSNTPSGAVTTSGTLTATLANAGNATVLGNVSGGSAAPIYLSKIQLTTLINAFTSSLSGAVPLSGGGTTNFLRADGSWAVPAGGGGGNGTSIGMVYAISRSNYLT